MLTPILVFTADEAWQFVPGKTVDSAHELTWQPMEFTLDTDEQETWKNLFQVRDLALAELEKARQAKQIGKALEAKLVLCGAESALTHANAHLESLRELLNVSQIEIRTTNNQSLSISVIKAEGQKCERCWHWETDVGSSPEHPTICARCVQAVQVMQLAPS